MPNKKEEPAKTVDDRKGSAGGIATPPPDPWTWDFESEDAYLDLIALSSYQPGSPTYIDKYHAVKRVRALRDRIESNAKGAGFDVLMCVRVCGANDLQMPLWLVHAFNRRFDAVLNVRALSWDDENSFGRPYPKSTNRAALRKKRKLMPAVWVKVAEGLEGGRVVDASLFEDVGKALSIGKTLAQNYYYSALRDFGYPDLVAERENEIAKLVGKAKAMLALGQVGAGMVKVRGLPAMDFHKFLEKYGNTNRTKKASIKSFVTTKDLNEPSKRHAAAEPKRAAAKAPAGRRTRKSP